MTSLSGVTPFGRTTESTLRTEGRDPGQGGHRLLPDRGTVVAHVVRPEVPPRLPERPELRRLLDGVGQPRADADREALRRAPPDQPAPRRRKLHRSLKLDWTSAVPRIRNRDNKRGSEKSFVLKVQMPSLSTERASATTGTSSGSRIRPEASSSFAR